MYFCSFSSKNPTQRFLSIPIRTATMKPRPCRLCSTKADVSQTSTAPRPMTRSMNNTTGEVVHAKYVWYIRISIHIHIPMLTMRFLFRASLWQGEQGEPAHGEREPVPIWHINQKRVWGPTAGQLMTIISSHRQLLIMIDRQCKRWLSNFINSQIRSRS